MLHKLPTEVELILAKFDLKLNDYRDVMHTLDSEMNKGLAKATHDHAAVKMFPSYVTRLPTGQESGQFIALDLGGTNYRVLLVTFKPGEKPTIIETNYLIPHEKMVCKGEELFDYVAQTLKDFVETHGVEKWPVNLGFIFSFPCTQESLNDAILVRWTKGYTASGCVGENVTTLLQRSIDKLKLQVKCVAVVNDTVGALMACILDDPKCCVGVIIGTGTNASYIEDIKKVETFKGDRNRHEFVLIDMEWGAFGEQGSLDKYRTEYDMKLDDNSVHPKQQILDKICSGMYLGELVRLILLDLIQRNILFRGVVPPSLASPGGFHTKYLSEIERDPPHLFHSTEYILTEDLHVPSFEDMDAIIIRSVCEKVTYRAASFLGAAIACLINRINKKEMTVGVDGSLYKFHSKIPERILSIIEQLKKVDTKFSIQLSIDGSGKGAAVIAALADQMK